MFTLRAALAAAACLCATASQAQSSFEYYLSAQQGGWDAPIDLIDIDPITGGPFATPGTVSVSQGSVFASFSGIADPTIGMFKSQAQVHLGAFGTAVAEGHMTVHDTLVFTGPQPTTPVSFTINWDTRVSGVDLGRPDTSAESTGGNQNFASTQFLTLGAPKPPPPPPVGCGSGDAASCTIEATEGPRPVHDLSSSSFQFGTQMLPGGVPDGRYTGSLRVSFDVPVGTDLVLDYSTILAAACVQMLSCDLSLDASHSDYIGISLEPGVSFVSANGYRYLGLAGVTAPVPEPATWLLALAGMGAMAGRARRANRAPAKPVTQAAATPLDGGL